MEHSRPYLSKTQNVCLVILWILFILLAFIMGREIINKKKNEKLTEFKEVTLEEDKYNQIFLGLLDDPLIPNSLLEKLYSGNFSSNTLSLTEKSLITLEKEQIIPDCSQKESYALSLDELNLLIAKYFEDTNLTPDDFKALIDKEELGQSYNLKYDGDVLEITNICHNNDQDLKVLTKYLQAYQNNEYLKIDLKVAFRKITPEKDTLVFNYFKDATQKIMQEKLYAIDEDKVTWDKYDTYEFLFKIKDNNYYLKEVSKL